MDEDWNTSSWGDWDRSRVETVETGNSSRVGPKGNAEKDYCGRVARGTSGDRSSVGSSSSRTSLTSHSWCRDESWYTSRFFPPRPEVGYKVPKPCSKVCRRTHCLKDLWWWWLLWIVVVFHREFVTRTVPALRISRQKHLSSLRTFCTHSKS